MPIGSSLQYPSVPFTPTPITSQLKELPGKPHATPCKYSHREKLYKAESIKFNGSLLTSAIPASSPSCTLRGCMLKHERHLPARAKEREGRVLNIQRATASGECVCARWLHNQIAPAGWQSVGLIVRGKPFAWGRAQGGAPHNRFLPVQCKAGLSPALGDSHAAFVCVFQLSWGDGEASVPKSAPQLTLMGHGWARNSAPPLRSIFVFNASPSNTGIINIINNFN